LFSKFKDIGISTLGKKFGNQFIKEYGEMLDLRLDSKNKKIELEILLKGELEPLKVDIGSYKIEQNGEKSYIILSEISTSREWINTLLEKFVQNKKFEISQDIEKVLGILV
jgi:hypothetical protein